MPAPTIHLAVAAAGLLLYFNDRRRVYALLLLPLALVPDLDYFIAPHVHRILFHSVFLLVPPLAIALYGRATKRVVLWHVGLLAGFCVLSHLVLDFFAGTEALFYPLTTARYGFVGRPAYLYQHVTYELLPRSVWPYSAEALGVMLCVIVFAALLAINRLFQVSTDPPGSVQTRS